MGKFREIGAIYSTKIKHYQLKLSEDRVHKSMVPAQTRLESIVGATGKNQFTKIKKIEPFTFDGDSTKFFEWKNLFENLTHNRSAN